MASADLIKRVKDETQRCIDVANTRYKPATPFKMPVIRYDLRGTVAGRASSDQWTIWINPILLEENVEDMITNTVPHEVAHLIDQGYLQRERNMNRGLRFDRRGRMRLQKREVHGPSWEGVMRVFGVPEHLIKRTHQYDTTNARVKERKRFKYKCACPNGVEAGPKHHKIIQLGHRVGHRGPRCLRCKMTLTADMWIRTPEATPTARPVVRAVPAYVPPINESPNWKGQSLIPDTPKPSHEGTNRQSRVIQIVQRMPAGIAPKEIIQTIMNELGMTKAGAQTYYYNAKKLLSNNQAAA